MRGEHGWRRRVFADLDLGPIVQIELRPGGAGSSGVRRVQGTLPQTACGCLALLAGSVSCARPPREARPPAPAVLSVNSVNSVSPCESSSPASNSTTTTRHLSSPGAAAHRRARQGTLAARRVHEGQRGSARRRGAGLTGARSGASAQLITYLRLTGKSVGLLINFTVTVLKSGVKRVVNAR